MRILWLWVVFLLNIAGLQAQYGVGWVTDNYAGINAAVFQPAATVNTPYAWDVNLLEVSQFVDNNYLYVIDKSGLGFLRSIRNAEVINVNDLDGPPTANQITFDFYDGDETRYFVNSTAIMGPSFSVRVGELARVGLFTRMRLLGSGRKLDGDISYYVYNPRPFDEAFTIDPMRLGMMLWSEVGANWSQAILLANGQLNIGANVRYLIGHQAGYAFSEVPFTARKVSDQIIGGEDFTILAGYTEDWIDGNYVLRQNGRGWGFDLGVQYLTGRTDAGRYRLKLGASLLDIGRIRYSGIVDRHQYVVEGYEEVSSNDYQRFFDNSSLRGLAAQFSEDVLGVADSSLVGKEFSLALPQTFSLQGEVAINDWAFVQAAYVGGLFPNRNSLQRGSLLTVGPRVEHRWFGASLPLAWYEFNRVKMGMTLRLGPLTLGTDNLANLARRQRLAGGSFLVALKLFPFFEGNGGGRRKTKSARSRGKEIKCYSF